MEDLLQQGYVPPSLHELEYLRYLTSSAANPGTNFAQQTGTSLMDCMQKYATRAGCISVRFSFYMRNTAQGEHTTPGDYYTANKL